jgi:glutamate-1-semialdehyde 2,1-aminomutase
MSAVETSVQRSQEMFERAQRVMAGGVSTAFRVSERPVPLFFEGSAGGRLRDVDGNEYVDFVCGYGPIVLGHANERVLEAVARAASAYQQVGGQNPLELELAELLCEHVPSYELVRIGLSGSEAIQAALRLARGATGRPLVVKFAGHYHGWFDSVFAGTGSLPPTLPETAGQSVSALADTVVIEWNDLDRLEALFATAGDRIAAVVMEAIPCNQGVLEPAPGYLEGVRELTQRNGTVLIFDEVITGFRLGLGGAQAQVGVTPDLTVTAKAMGNGFPVSAFGGRRELMELVASNKVVHAGTFNAGGVSVAAALATIEQLAEHDGVLYTQMAARGRRLMEGLAAAAAAAGVPLQLRGPGQVFFAWISEPPVDSYRDHRAADHAAYARFAEALSRQGVRVIPAGRWYLNAAHTDEDIDVAIAAAQRAFAELAALTRR